MSLLQLADLKAYARIDTDEDDITLQLILDAAEEFAFGRVGMVYASAVLMPAMLKTAILAMASDASRNRESQQPVQLYANRQIEAILEQCRFANESFQP